MQFRYPARLQPDRTGSMIVSFRDLPECLTAGADEAGALKEAGDALEEAIAGRIDDGEPIPVPSRLRAGERLIAVPPDMAAKAAFVLAFRASGLSRLAVARRLGVNEKSSGAGSTRVTTRRPPACTGRCGLSARNSLWHPRPRKERGYLLLAFR